MHYLSDYPQSTAARVAAELNDPDWRLLAEENRRKRELRKEQEKAERLGIDYPFE